MNENTNDLNNEINETIENTGNTPVAENTAETEAENTIENKSEAVVETITVNTAEAVIENASETVTENTNENTESITYNEGTVISDPYSKYAQGYYYEPEKQEQAASSEKQTGKRSLLSKFLITAAMAAVFGLVAGAIFVGATWLYKEQNPSLFEEKSRKAEVTITDNKATASYMNVNSSDELGIGSTSTIDAGTFSGTDVSAVVEKAMPSIVSIECTSKVFNYYYGGTYNSQSAGSGIIIQKTGSELMIATNNHVIDGASEISVTFTDGSKAAATVRGQDEVNDLAVIAVKLDDIEASTMDAIAIAQLGNSDEVKIGQMAIAIGNSLGYGQSVTVGYISAKDRDITIDGQKYTNLLQTDAAINPGNSGGALVNIKGEVIGINNAKSGGSSVEGMGYAIPISKAQKILEDFANREELTSEEQGFLGVSIKTVTSDIAAMYGWPVGAYISYIVEDSAAEKAGLQLGDIITAIDGTEIRSDEGLVSKIQSLRHGTEIKVTIQRLVDGQYIEKVFNITLGKRPVEETN